MGKRKKKEKKIHKTEIRNNFKYKSKIKKL